MKNYYKPTPIKWRKLGDAVLFLSTGVSGLIMAAPVTDHTKTWIMLGLSIVGLVGKTLTNFFSDDNNSSDNGQIR